MKNFLLPDFKTIKSTTLVYCNTGLLRQVGHMNSIDSPGKNPHVYNNYILKKGAKLIQWWKDDAGRTV